jgi:hypothetical protein
MRRIVLPAGVAALAALALIPAANAAAAKPGPDALPAQAGSIVIDNTQDLKSAAPAALASELLGKNPVFQASPDVTGYTVVHSGHLSNPNNRQSSGSVSCPAGTVAFGGGVFGSSQSIEQNVNSSAPQVSGGIATGWVGYVDNLSGADATFSVWAVCAKKPKSYAVVTLVVDNPALTQTYANVQCPAGPSGKAMKVLGGGGIGESTGLLQNLNTDFPSASTRSWRLDVNNAGPTNETVRAYAVCGSVSGWAVVRTGNIANPALSQTSARVACPTGKTSIGGGVFSDSHSLWVNLNATWPDSGISWESFENNGSPINATIQDFAVCLI